MSAVFSYLRVSTTDQNTDNQKLEILAAGYKPDFWFSDSGISGKTPAASRPQFKLLLEKIRDGETLVVSKLDRLGRDSIDVLQTIRMLSLRNIKIIVLQLGNTDLTSTAGKLLLTVLSAVATMERDLLIERTQAGLARAKAEGKTLGRPSKTTKEQQQQIIEKLTTGESVSAVAKDFGISRASVINIRNILNPIV
jgi:putative DNA-invertase from lambdoid prophage Rac